MFKQIMIYEHALKEHIKVFLRIERLFHDLDRFLRFNIDANIALGTTCSIIRNLERPDLKAKLTNALHQHQIRFNNYVNNPRIEQAKLAPMINKIEEKIKFLRSYQTLLELMPNSHLLLKKVQAEMISHGASALIGDPIFYAWDSLTQPESFRLLNEWRLELNKLFETICFCLELVRMSQDFKEVKCNNHFYSQTSNIDNCQLIRIKLDDGIIPEFSAGRHHVAIRFLSVNLTNDDVKLSDKKVEKFDIAFCI